MAIGAAELSLAQLDRGPSFAVIVGTRTSAAKNNKRNTIFEYTVLVSVDQKSSSFSAAALGLPYLLPCSLLMVQR